MAPLLSLRVNEPLEAGQTTIFSTLNSSLGLARPPLLLRPGRIPKSSSQADTVLGRRLVGSTNERQVISLFATFQLASSTLGEPGDNDNIVERVVIEEEELELEDESEYIPQHRYSYLREYKLAAIDYFQTTQKKLKDDTYKRLSCRYAA